MNFKITILIFMLVMIDPTKISKINKLKSDAQKAFNEGRYKEASQKYRYLIDSLNVNEDEVKLNLAHANYLSKDTANARPLYQELTQSSNKEIRSKAFQQLGLMSNSLGKSEEALNQFKQAIKAHPSNVDARYNYEMLKKKLEEQKKKDQQKNKDQDKNKDQKEDQEKKEDKKQDQNKDKQNKEDQKKEQEKKEQQDQQKKGQEKKDQEGKKEDQEKKDQQEKKEQSQEAKEDQQKKDEQKVPQQVSDKLKQMNISEEKAKMILEAMKNQEVQYLQQNTRKATKPKDKGKPDW